MSTAYVSWEDSVRLDSAAEKRRYSAARPSLRRVRRSIMLQRFIYVSALRRTPARTVSNKSGNVFGSESSRSGGSGLPVNSSWTERLACFRQTASSYSWSEYDKLKR